MVPVRLGRGEEVKKDILLYGLSETQLFDDLMRWANGTPIHEFTPDFHRLQVEHWVWANRGRLTGVVIDVGARFPRRWIGPEYRTLGLVGCDVIGDLCAMPLHGSSVDGMILTEVLEHCEHPFNAIREVRRVLKPGGLLLVTSPFVWPWHGTEEYRDFWRFTPDAWRLLLKEFSNVVIGACRWTDEGKQMYDLMRRFECMGYTAWTTASTGYLCEAIR